MGQDPEPPSIKGPFGLDRRAAPVLLGGVLLAALLLSRLDFVPIWDGRIYADCVRDAARAHLAPGSLRCADHTSHAYIFLLALPQLVRPGSFAAMLVTNLALGLLALAAFDRLLRRLFPAGEQRVELAMVALAMAVHPVFVASAVQPNVDFGAMVFFLPCLVALLEKRVWPTVAFATLMVFSKETGALIYATMLASYAVVFVARGEDSLAAKRAALRAMVPYTVPLVVVGLYFAIHPLFKPHLHVLWTAPGAGSPSHDLTSFRLLDPVFHGYLAGIFVANFFWLPALFVAQDAARGLFRATFRLGAPPVAGAEPALLRYTLILTALLVLVLTRYRTFTNLRYFLPLYPLLLVAFYAALVRLPVRPRVRVLVLGVVAVLFFASNLRTLDPVSRAVYGTFAFGRHELLDTTSITRECCGRGRDQLVYNLEFTEFGTLQNQVFRALRPTADTVFVADHWADWFLLGRLDARTHERTLRTAEPETFALRLTDARVLVSLPYPPAEAYYLAFANVGNRASLDLVSQRYQIGEPRTFEHAGYALTVYHLTAR